MSGIPDNDFIVRKKTGYAFKYLFGKRFSSVIWAMKGHEALILRGGVGIVRKYRLEVRLRFITMKVTRVNDLSFWYG